MYLGSWWPRMVSLKYLGDRILLGADWLGDWLGMRNVSLRWLEGWGGLASHEWIGIREIK